MTISVKHAFTSAKADGTDSTLIQPSNWNAEHTITAAAGKILGRASGTAGAIQELSLAFDSTGQSMIPPSGDTASRPTGAAGMFRYNTTDNLFEYYNGTAWGSMGSTLTAIVTGGTGAASTLTLQSTSGTGTSDAIIFNTGSQVERMRINSTGAVGIGSTSLTVTSLRVSKNITGGTTAYGVFSDGAVQSDVTSSAIYFGTDANAASGTITSLIHYRANQSTLGTATVSNQYGFTSDNGLIGATNNYAFNAANTAAVTAGKTAYGFRSDINIATGGGTTYGFYAAGTADNYFLGDVSIGNVTAPLSKLVVSANATTTLQAATTGTLAHFANATDTSAVLLLDSHGTASGLRNEIVFRRSRGTAAAPAAITSGNNIGAITSYGYGASAYSATSRASIIMSASENWTASAQGTSIAINTTASGTITPTEVVTIGNDGVVTGTAGNLMLVSGTSVSISGTPTSVAFTGLPSWVKRIVIQLQDVSTNGTSNYIVQLGTGATPTYVATSYSGACNTQAGTGVQNSTGFTIVNSNVAANTWSGHIILTNITGNIWVESSNLGATDATSNRYSSGNNGAGAQLTAVRITTVIGTQTFDTGGVVNISYE